MSMSLHACMCVYERLRVVKWLRGQNNSLMQLPGNLFDYFTHSVGHTKCTVAFPPVTPPISHGTVNIGDNISCTCATWSDSAAAICFGILSVSVRLWVHPNVASWLILNFNYSHPNQLHSLSRSPELFPVSLHFSLFLAFCPATAAPSINVLPDCIPLIPTCFLWLEEQWALLAAKLHLGAFTWASGKKWVSIWASVKISFDNDFCCKYFT